MPPRLAFDRVASIYDETRGHPPKVLARVLRVLVEELQGMRVLEVGVGTGRYAVPLQKSGIDVVGIDISHKMVELGLAKGLRNIVFGEGAHLPFRDRMFDVATTNHVLHLVPDWPDVLREIGRVTSGQYFTIIEHNDERWGIKREYDRLVRESGHEWKTPGFHERDLRDLVTADVVMPVGPFHEEFPSNGVLAELERRDYSSQWDVPESIHGKVMAELRARYGDRTLARTVTLEVTFWRIERLADAAAAYRPS